MVEFPVGPHQLVLAVARGARSQRPDDRARGPLFRLVFLRPRRALAPPRGPLLPPPRPAVRGQRGRGAVMRGRGRRGRVLWNIMFLEAAVVGVGVILWNRRRRRGCGGGRGVEGRVEGANFERQGPSLGRLEMGAQFCAKGDAPRADLQGSKDAKEEIGTVGVLHTNSFGWLDKSSVEFEFLFFF